MHVSKKPATELDVNQDATIVSDKDAMEHGINVQDMTLPEESPWWAKVLLLAIVANNMKLDTKFAEAQEESDSLTAIISSLLTTVYNLTEANKSPTQEDTQLKGDLLWLEYHQRRTI